ncbi:MAG: glycoside hydrolase family 3 C-terminal domain-containing protein, partial [Gemmatimonadaceae bacterium]
ISDAAAVGGATVLHHTEATTATSTRDALDAGLDVIFQSAYEQHRPYLDAFRRGTIADSTINAAVTRVLRAKLELGLFEHPYVDPDSAAFWNGNAAHRALAREAARESIVLLRNEGGLLPLRKDRNIAVIGADAEEARLGGYSGAGIEKISIVDGVREAVARGATVRFAPGPGRITKEYAIVPAENLSVKTDSGMKRGLRGEYFDNNRLDGSPRVVRTDEKVDFGTLKSPARGIPFDWYSVRWTGTLTAPRAGVR